MVTRKIDLWKGHEERCLGEIEKYSEEIERENSGKRDGGWTLQITEPGSKIGPNCEPASFKQMPAKLYSSIVNSCLIFFQMCLCEGRCASRYMPKKGWVGRSGFFLFFYFSLL